MKVSEIYNDKYFEEYNSGCNRVGYLFDELYLYFNYISNGLIKTLKSHRVLDIGCAKGFIVYCMFENNIETYGIDISDYAVKNAPKEIKGHIMLVDAERYYLPFVDNSFDLILLLDVIEHLHTHSFLLSEIYRVLEPNGICCIKTPIKDSDQAKRDHTHINIHDQFFWKDEFKDKGFKIVNNKKLINGTWVKYYQSLDASSRVAQLLLKFGRHGKIIRNILIQKVTYHALRNSVFLLKKEQK